MYIREIYEINKIGKLLQTLPRAMRVTLSSSRHRERLPFSFEIPGNIANDIRYYIQNYDN